MTVQETDVEMSVITAVLKELPEAERIKFYYMLLGARAIEGYQSTSDTKRNGAS